MKNNSRKSYQPGQN